MFFCNKTKSLAHMRSFIRNDLQASPINPNTTVVYIANPLSPLCWEHRALMAKIQHYCTLKNIHFSMVMGYWQPKASKQCTLMTSFLKNDTEPACRAVAAARIMLLQNDQNDQTLFQFFTSIQEKFFETGEDATHALFYQSICEALHLDYHAFEDIFNIISTTVEFQTVKQKGCTNVPSVMLEHYEILHPLSTEFLSLQDITAKIDGFLAKAPH